MKKVLMVGIALCFLLISTQQGFSQLRRDISVAKGNIVAKDDLKGEITILDMYTGVNKTFMVPGGVSNFAKDTMVQVIHKKGSNVAQTVNVIKPRVRKY